MSRRKKDDLPFTYGTFAVYHGDRNIEDGSYEEISQKYGLSYDMMKYYASNAYHKRVRNTVKQHKATIELVRIDTIEEDDIFEATDIADY